MAEKHFVVHGATCQCQFSEKPQTDVLLVKTHSKHYANDSEGKEKLVATSKEIGQTMQKNTFGNCKMQPSGSSFLPCQIVIQEWSGFYEKVTYSNKGNPLLEDSKATCPIGGKDCITIKDHGQKAELTEKNTKSSSPEVLYELLPGVNFSELDDAVLMINNTANE
ncbi:DUF4280 domain-containing protein [Flavobacterium sp. ANB]|uniref:DUF4280 domain-containing protein n=1 Tax=unclassified Flavobacterium TaxID=196869 RepID=UPI0012B6D7A7|nr:MULTISPECIES: DUF4280 domain-containing protein [unclassified Flavobacterium]MBF4517903.1 DUF4280 domain-containing protein [Flavobacterium sp. ANB]MTD72027.1 DUF4280 domain-containing protein [Flavobacterium sp. LC2016-13]